MSSPHVDVVHERKILTICSRKGPAVGLFCRLAGDTKTSMKDIWVVSAFGKDSHHLEKLDNRATHEQPDSWTSLDSAEFQTIHKLVPFYLIS